MTIEMQVLKARRHIENEALIPYQIVLGKKQYDMLRAEYKGLLDDMPDELTDEDRIIFHDMQVKIRGDDCLFIVALRPL